LAVVAFKYTIGKIFTKVVVVVVVVVVVEEEEN